MLMKDVSAHDGGRGESERSIGSRDSSSEHRGRAEASSTHNISSESSSTGGSSHGGSSEGSRSKSGHGGSPHGRHGGNSKKGGHHKQSGKPYSTSNLSQIAYTACSQLVSATATFCDSNSEYSSACFCVDPNALATIAGCYHIANKASKNNVKTLSSNCEEYKINISFDQFEAAYKNYTLYAKETSKIKNFDASVPVDVPIKLNATSVNLYQESYKQSLGNAYFSLFYGSGILGYWALVFLITAISNWSKHLFPGLIKKFTGPVSNKWRKYITLPATGTKSKTNEKPLLKFFDFLVPTRLETIIIVGFTALTIAACSAQIKYVENGPRNDNKHQTLLRLVADRTGIISTIIMPLLILFAGRNNVLQWLTRWDFATFIAFHRWVARVVFILVFIHSIAYTAVYLMSGRYYTRMQNNFMIWGTVATVAGGIITFQGMLYFRRKWYEIFLITHIIMAALFIGGAWIHVDGLGYAWFYYATVAVWVFDRVVRIGRLIAFGCPKSEVILLADETLKVVVPKPSYWKSSPGGHAFIHFIRPSCFWQSHPFTYTCSEEENKIVLYCKVKGGVTHGLYQYLASHPGRTTKIRVSLEGPYGESTAAKNYDTAVFVAGGNGIPGIYSEIHDLAVRSKSNIKQSLKLVWVVREYRSLYWFYAELVALKTTKINTTIYITKPELEAHVDEFNNRIPIVTNESASDFDVTVEKKFESVDDTDSFKEKDSSGDNTNEDPVDKNRIIGIVKSELSHITFKEGRPSMEEMVLQEIDESNGSVAFVTCGHPLMVDDLRHSVVKNLDNTTRKRVEFFEQLQVWT